MSRYHSNSRAAVVVFLSLFLNPSLSRGFSAAPDLLDQSIFAFEFFTFARGEVTMLEVFCEIPAQDFQFVKYDRGFYASYEITLALFNSDQQPVSSAVFVDSTKVTTFEQMDRPQAPHLVRFEFAAGPGTYTARIAVTDLETHRKAEFDKTVELPDYARQGLALSDLQIAKRITHTSKPGLLVKSGKEIVPNVRRVISPDAENIYLYAEIYDLDFSETVESRFVLTYSIVNANGVEIKRERAEMRTPDSSTTLAIKIGLGAAEEGVYALHLLVEDLRTQRTTQKSTSFQIVSIHPNNI